ncbi:HNH endonuclease [Paenibacillus frigoriresistens]|nr:HNH endonuclease [Paenibacillus frigoriresistens]
MRVRVTYNVHIWSNAESHHLIPISKQGLFRMKLDKLSNICPLCPHCHRLIHLGIEEERQQMIEVLYEKRREQLLSVDLNVSLVELRLLYGLKK